MQPEIRTPTPLNHQFINRLLPLAILLLGFALRLYLLAESNIWYDEGLAVWAARQSPADIAAWTSADVHPPLYFWMLHLWRLLVGDSEFAVRWLSVAIGLLAVAVTFTLARRLTRDPSAQRIIPAIAFVAMAALATSRFHIWWSQEARMYILGSLWVALSLYFTVKLREGITAPRVVGYLLTTIAALYTLYLLAFLLVIEGLYWLITLPRSRAALRSVGAWAVLQVVTLAAFAPWLLYALPRMNQWSVQVAFDGAQYARLYATLFTLGISTDIERVAFLMVLVVGALLLGMGLAWQTPRYRRGLLLMALAVLIPPLVVWLTTTLPREFGYSPKPEARYFVPYVPAFSILAAWGIVTLGQALSGAHRRARRVIVITALVGMVGAGVSGWTLSDYYNHRLLTDEYRSITTTMRDYWQTGDAALLHSDQPWPVFVYHWTDAWQGVTYTQEVDKAGTLNEVYPLWEQHDAVWLVLNEDAPRIDAQRSVEGWLGGQAIVSREWRFGTKRLLLFVRSPERAATLDSLPLLSNGVWEQPVQRVRPGMMAHFFYTDAFGAAELPLTLTVGDPTAAIATATTSTTRADKERLQWDVLIPPTTPPATYALTLTNGAEQRTVGTLTILPPLSVALLTPSPLPEDAVEVNAMLGDAIRLEGYTTEAQTLYAGGTVPITLYWQATQPVLLPYKVFLHLAAADEEIYAQADSEPLNGSRITTGWQVGERITDPYTLTLDPATPAGIYRVWVGMYDPATGERVTPVADANGAPQADDRLFLFEIEVK